MQNDNIKRQQQEINYLKQELANIKKSLSWRLIVGCQRVADFVFKRNPFVGRYYEKFIFSLRKFFESELWLRINGNTLGPDFLIIGAQRSGTTSLLKYLSYHQQVLVTEPKELHFFYPGPSKRDYFHNAHQTIAWYENQFPKTNNRLLDVIFRRKKIKGEATPEYLYHPSSPKRVSFYYPKVKLIILLRDPLDRAISQYYHSLKYNFASPAVSLEEAFANDVDVNPGQEEKIIANPDYYSHSHQHHSYITRGDYNKQLARWRKYFPEEQMLILKSEDFFAAPYATLIKVCRFLKIAKYPENLKDKLEVFNKVDYKPISEERKKGLAKYINYDYKI